MWLYVDAYIILSNLCMCYVAIYRFIYYPKQLKCIYYMATCRFIYYTKQRVHVLCGYM